MQIQALNDQILIRLVMKSKSDGGILLPASIEGLEPHGLVVSVGEKVTCCAPGDKILMNPNSPMEINHEGEKLYFVQDYCVMGKYVPDNVEPVGAADAFRDNANGLIH